VFAPTRYLEWARRFFGQVRFDLASSGMPIVPLAELGLPDVPALDAPDGPVQLREAIARHNDVPVGEVVPAFGTSQGVWLAMAALTSPGDDVLVESPAYEPLVRNVEGAGARLVPFMRDPADGYALDPDRVARAMTPRTRAIVVSNLHNPTGVRASDDALRAIAAFAEARSAHLVVDEVYASFDDLVDASGVFRASARKLAPNVVAVSSLTKCYGLGNLRVGWLLGPPDVARRADDAVNGALGHVPLVYANLGVHAFSRLGELANRSRAVLAGKRARVAAWIASEGLAWSAPTAGLFGLVRIPGAGDLTPAIERAAREREVLVSAGAFFGVPNGLRLAWSAPMPVLEEGLGRLGEVLRPLRRG
jgi:aspartate/methionine/tyrosine aminotransferase